MASIEPKFITFDLYGTLIHFQMNDMARKVYADRIAAAEMDEFIRAFSAYRVDEVLGAWKPYGEVIRNATRRACKHSGIAYRDEDGKNFYEAVPTWGTHADVPAPLARVAQRYPLVILSNASDDQIPSNIAKLGAPVHAVFTAQQAQAYKPRMQAFEYMLDQLGCTPADLLHVSASMRYDLMTARDLGIPNRVYVNRGYEPPSSFYATHEIKDIGGLPAIVGL